MIHLLKVPDHPPLRTPENPSQKEWEEIARAFYRFKYTYWDKTPEEILWVESQKAWLDGNIPEALRDGVHLLERRGGFMGEDVWVADGQITHTLHVECGKCFHYTLIWRGKNTWCLFCKKRGFPPKG